MGVRLEYRWLRRRPNTGLQPLNAASNTRYSSLTLGIPSAGNLNAVSHIDMPNDLRNENIYARLWAGLHYHFSSVAGVVLGRDVEKYDLRQAFRPLR